MIDNLDSLGRFIARAVADEDTSGGIDMVRTYGVVANLIHITLTNGKIFSIDIYSAEEK